MQYQLTRGRGSVCYKHVCRELEDQLALDWGWPGQGDTEKIKAEEAVSYKNIHGGLQGPLAGWVWLNQAVLE